MPILRVLPVLNLFDCPRRDAQDGHHVEHVVRVVYARHDAGDDVAAPEYDDQERFERRVEEREHEVHQQHRAVAAAERAQQVGQLRVQQPQAFRERGHVGVRHPRGRGGSGGGGGGQRARQAQPQGGQHAEPVAHVVQVETGRDQHGEHDGLGPGEQEVQQAAFLHERGGVLEPVEDPERHVVRVKSDYRGRPEPSSRQIGEHRVRQQSNRIEQHELTVVTDHSVDEPGKNIFFFFSFITA